MINIGHTGITWGYPAELGFFPGSIAEAYAAVADLGYRGFETFGRTITGADGDCDGYADLASRCGIPTVAAYCLGRWISPDGIEEEIADALRAAEALKVIGGKAVVLACESRPRPEGCTEDELAVMATALTRIAEACADLGVQAGLHPHTGTAIETQAEIQAIMNLTESPLGLVPDSGQIAKAGGDVVEVFATYLDRIVHVHLKDWNGVTADDDEASDRSGYFNYTPIGEGVVPIGDLLVLLADANFDGWVNVELDGTPWAPRSSKQAAALSCAYLKDNFGAFINWAPGTDGAVEGALAEGAKR